MKNSKTIKLSKNAKLELDIHPMLGLLIGMDRYHYSSKTKTKYILFILCFSMEIEITRKKKKRNE
jgi:hypothetical protein